METRTVFLCQALGYGGGFLQNLESSQLHRIHLGTVTHIPAMACVVAAFSWYLYSSHSTLPVDRAVVTATALPFATQSQVIPFEIHTV